MSRTTVRAAIAGYMAPPAIATLLQVHAAKPRNWKPEVEYDSAVPSSAAAYVHIEGVDERQPGPHKRTRDYACALVVYFRSVQPDSEVMMQDFDSLMDAITARLRTKGLVTGGAFDAAIYDVCGRMLSEEADLPQEEPAASAIWARVRFDIQEMVTV